MLNILICDDNQLHLEYIHKLTQKSATNSRIRTFNNGDTLSCFFIQNPHHADIIICDIKLGKINGIKLIQKLKEINPNVQIIFISAYLKYFQEVYSVDHVYFLGKPIKHDQFQIALKKAVKKALQQREEYITITKKGTISVVNLNNIYYIEAALRQIKIHTKNTVYTKYAKITDFIKQLDERFLICHKSYAVNMDKVIQLEKNNFILLSKTNIPISRARFNEAKTKFINYLGEVYE